MSLLDTNADGIALLFWAFSGMTVALLLALGFEAWLARGMRQRRREREALIRYCASIEGTP